MSHPTRRDMEEKITLRSTTFHHVAFDFIDGVISVPGLVVCSKKTENRPPSGHCASRKAAVSPRCVRADRKEMRAATAGVVFALRIRRALMASLI